MGRFIAQNSSANVVIGPLVNISASVMSALAIANTNIIIIKEGSTSAARVDTASAVSVGPGMYRIGLLTADTDTLGTLTIFVSGSGAMPYAKDVEVWQSTTWNLYYGSAQQILTSAAASALISVVGNVVAANRSAAISGIVIQALTDYQAVTSAGLSVQLSVRAHNALVNYDVASSADVSAIVEAVSMTSASVSSLIQNALVNYDVATSADVSAIVSAVVSTVLANYDVASSADVSAIVSAVVSGVLNSYNVASAGEVASAGINSAGISAIVQGALTNYDVPTSADVSVIVAANAGAGINSAQASTIMVQVLTDYDAPTSADISAIGVQVLTNYDVPTSADISAIGSVVAARAIASARVNVGFVNNVSVGGVGTTANPWGPT